MQHPEDIVEQLHQECQAVPVCENSVQELLPCAEEESKERMVPKREVPCGSEISTSFAMVVADGFAVARGHEKHRQKLFEKVRHGKYCQILVRGLAPMLQGDLSSLRTAL